MRISRDEFQRVCETAEGYIELGLLEDALNILDGLPTPAKISTEVIVLHMAILVKSGQQLKASYLGENLCFGDPGNVVLSLEVGQLKHVAGEHTEAIKWLKSVEPHCHSSALFHLLRAKCHAALGDFEACKIALQRAHAIDPDMRVQSVEDPRFEAIFGADAST